MKAENEKIFKKIESNLRTAYYSDYTRAVPSNYLQEAERAYRDETGFEGTVFVGYNCNICVLNGLKRIGAWYFEKVEKEVKEVKEEKPIVKKETIKKTTVKKKQSNVRKKEQK